MLVTSLLIVDEGGETQLPASNNDSASEENPTRTTHRPQPTQGIEGNTAADWYHLAKMRTKYHHKKREGRLQTCTGSRYQMTLHVLKSCCRHSSKKKVSLSCTFK